MTTFWISAIGAFSLVTGTLLLLRRPRRRVVVLDRDPVR